MNRHIPATDGDLVDLAEGDDRIPFEFPIPLFHMLQHRTAPGSARLVGNSSNSPVLGQGTIFAPSLLDDFVVPEDIGEVEQVSFDVGEDLAIDLHLTVQAVNGEDFLAKFGAGCTDVGNAGFGDLIISDAFGDEAPLDDPIGW